MIALEGILLPLLCHLLGTCQILVGSSLIASQACQHAISCHAADSLEREVAVVCPVARKVIGTELIAGILTIL